MASDINQTDNETIQPEQIKKAWQTPEVNQFDCQLDIEGPIKSLLSDNSLAGS